MHNDPQVDKQATKRYGTATRTTPPPDPFGATTVSGGSASVYSYTGRENDGTGLYYFRARYYNPSIGRFLSEDPMERVASHLYAYVDDNPVNERDPWGLFEIKDEIQQDTSGEWRNKCPSGSESCTIIGPRDLSLDCDCNPVDQDCATKWKQTLTFHMGGHMYLDNSPTGRRGVDPRIRTIGPARLASLRDHEYNVHINPAKNVVADRLSTWEGHPFDTKDQCDHACEIEKAIIPAIFLNALGNTPRY